MTANQYIEKLRDPRWQRKRLEILQRDDWTCQSCGNKKATLVVHHHSYEKDKEPWEYDNNSLVTLCESCHEAQPNIQARANPAIGFMSLLWPEDMEMMCVSIGAHGPWAYRDPIIRLAEWVLANDRRLPEIAKALQPLISTREFKSIMEKPEYYDA